MLYENEELRLRTININAEVEKGIVILYLLWVSRGWAQNNIRSYYDRALC